MSRFLPIALLLGGCTAPEMSGAFNQVEVYVDATPSEVNARFADFVGQAKHTLHVALPTEQDGQIAAAVLDAWAHGVEVEVVTDIDEAEATGVVWLLEAGVPVTLADGGLDYFDFNVNAPVRFDSDKTVLSNSWVVVDQSKALIGTRAGFVSTGETIAVEISGEEPIEDILAEHRQLFGGIDATATTAFDALAKSTADIRWRYPTNTDADIEIWFGPQERLIKRLIDGIYAARGSVHLLTNDLTDAGLARALEDKAKYGFHVEAVVGPLYDRATSRAAAVFQTSTPNVVKRRYTGAEDMPTILLVDWDKGIDGRAYTTRAFVLSHDVYTTSRIEAAIPPPPFSEEPYLGPVTDQLIDGTLLVLRDYDEADAELQAIHDLWQRHADAAGEL